MSRVNSRRRDALTAAPKQDTAPLPNTEMRAPFSQTPQQDAAQMRRTPEYQSRRDYGRGRRLWSRQVGWMDSLHLTTSHRLRSAMLDPRRRIAFGSTVGPNEFVEVIHLEKEFGPIEFAMTHFVLTRIRNSFGHSQEFSKIHLLIRDVRRHQMFQDDLGDLGWHQFNVAKVEVVSMLALLWLHVCCIF